MLSENLRLTWSKMDGYVSFAAVSSRWTANVCWNGKVFVLQSRETGERYWQPWCARFALLCSALLANRPWACRESISLNVLIGLGYGLAKNIDLQISWNDHDWCCAQFFFFFLIGGKSNWDKLSNRFSMISMIFLQSFMRYNGDIVGTNFAWG